MPTESIRIQVSEKGAAAAARSISAVGTAGTRADAGLRRTQRGLDAVSRSSAATSRAVASLNGILARFAGVIAVDRLARGFLSLTNEAVRLDNRLRTVTSSSQQLESTHAKLLKIANDTRTAFGSTVELFTRTSGAAKELGRTEEDLLRFTKALSQEVKLSGASAEEANAALIQLSQGIASGTLRGDELRSVLEQLPTVADRIAEHLGVTRGELRELGADGKVSANDIIQAFLNAEDAIGRRFRNAVLSPADAFVVLRNNVLEAVRSFDRATGFSRALSDAIVGMAENVNQLAVALGTTLALQAIPAAIRGLNALRLVLIRHPIGLIAVALATVIGYLTGFSGDIAVTTDGIVKLRDVGVAAFTVIKQRIDDLVSSVRNQLGPAFQFIDALLKQFPNLDLSAAGITKGIAALLDGFLSLPNAISSSLFTLVRSVVSELGLLLKLLILELGRLIESVANLIADRLGLGNSAAVEAAALAARQVSGLGFTPAGDALANAVRTQLGGKSRDFITGTQFFKDLENEVAIHVGDGVAKGLEKYDPSRLLQPLQFAAEDFASFFGPGTDRGSTFFQSLVGDVGELSRKLAEQRLLINEFRNITATGAELFNQIGLFSQSALAFQENAKNLSAEAQAQGAEALARGSQQISLAAQNLFTQVGAFLKTAATTAVTEARALFVSGAAQIGQAAGAAMLAGFRSGAGGVLGSLAGSLGAALGSGGPQFGQGAGANDTGTVSPAVQANLDALKQSRTELQGLIDSLRNVGPEAQQSFSAAANAANGFGGNVTNIGQQVNNVFQNAFSGLENALVSFVTTGKLDFKSLINSILADLARMVVQMLIIRPLMGFFGGLFGGFFGFSGGGYASPAYSGFPGFRSGGFVDLHHAIPGFAGGGSIGGFGSSLGDNILARLSPGEFVVNARATRENRHTLERMNAGVSPQSAAIGTVQVVNAPVINYTSNGGGNGSENQANAKALSKMIHDSMIEFVTKEQRPGGALYTGAAR